MVGFGDGVSGSLGASLPPLRPFFSIHVTAQQQLLGAGRKQCNTKPVGGLDRWPKPFLDQRWQEPCSSFTLLEFLWLEWRLSSPHLLTCEVMGEPG